MTNVSSKEERPGEIIKVPTPTNPKDRPSLLPATFPANLGSEKEEKIHVGEVIRAFIQRRYRIGVFERARVLFDPKMLPGVTPQEALDFLIKGLKLEASEEQSMRQRLNPQVAQHIRENFPDFTGLLKQQNNERTVDDIWMATDADLMTKMALQWEIQGDQLKDEYIEEHATKVAADLRELDSHLKGQEGLEVVIKYDSLQHFVGFFGLNVADGKGLDFVRPIDSTNPYRDLVLHGPSAYCEQDWLGENYENIHTAPNLIVPFKARSALQTVANSRHWETERYFANHRFDPKNNFRGVIFGDETTDLREADAFLFNKYKVFKEAIDRFTSSQSDRQ